MDCQEKSEQSGWEPLPKRRSRRQQERQRETCHEAKNLSLPFDDKDSNGPASKDMQLSKGEGLKEWEENVLERANIQWPEAQVEAANEDFRGNFEYLDHTADVQFHSWGSGLEEAFEHMVLCFFNFVTDIRTIQIDPSLSQEFTVSGHDLHSLLFAFLDEFLFRFSADGFACRQAKILNFNREDHTISVQGEGELFDLSKHPQGTEIKAITYSNMQIHEEAGRTDLYVIVDI